MKQRSLSFAALLLACTFFPRAAGAAVISDVEFARPDGVPLQLDLDIPDGAGPFPLVLFVHGGDFIAGNRKGTSKGLIAALREAGIAWASMDYRLAPQVRFPKPTQDIEAAVRFLKKRASQYHLNPDRIALMGESAGVLLVSYAGATARGDGRVAAVVGVSGTHDLYRRMHPVGPCFVSGKFVPNPHPGEPQFCLPIGIGQYLNVTGPGADAERRIQEASPAAHVHKDMPPYLLVHGTLDVNAPFEQSVFMLQAMRAAGAPCDLLAIDGGGHGMGSWDRTPALAGYRPRMVDWLKRVLLRNRPGEPG